MTITLSLIVFPSGQTGEPAALAPLPGDSTEGQRLLRRQKVQISNNTLRTFVSQQVYVHMWMYHMYQYSSFLMWHHVEMIYLNVLLLEGRCQVTREQGHGKEPPDSVVLWPWRLWPLHWDKRNLCLQIICTFKTLISSQVPSILILMISLPPPLIMAWSLIIETHESCCLQITPE